jgi:hypothetical protein
MSHVIKLKLEIRDKDLFARVARDLGLEIKEAPVRFFDGSYRTGLAVKLPGWTYPVLVDSEGQVTYDNYGGHWGNITELNRLTQEYVARLVEREAVLSGQFAVRQTQADGSLVIRVGGW